MSDKQLGEETETYRRSDGDRAMELNKTDSRDVSRARRKSNRDVIIHSDSKNHPQERQLSPEDDTSIHEKNEQSFNERSHKRSNDSPDKLVHEHVSKGMDVPYFPVLKTHPLNYL